jgi:hypothetical protein
MHLLAPVILVPAGLQQQMTRQLGKQGMVVLHFTKTNTRRGQL